MKHLKLSAVGLAHISKGEFKKIQEDVKKSCKPLGRRCICLAQAFATDWGHWARPSEDLPERKGLH